ncbi:MAG: transposase [Rhizobacter sp.]|nr:transposase [Rhizobacter sp.]
MDVHPDSVVGAWRSLPLCRRYRLVRFCTVSVCVAEGRHVSPHSVRWAVGQLRDGQREVLGVWAAEGAGAMQWGDIFWDLRVRGVEQIESVDGIEGESPQRSLESHYPRANAVGACLGDLDSQLIPRLKIRTVQRGRFDGIEAVLAEITAVLRRAYAAAATP